MTRERFRTLVAEAIDSIPPADAARAGFRQLMRSGGPFDPAPASGGHA